MHTPAWHESLMVQYCPSSQANPSLTGTDLQPITGSHMPTVHSPFRKLQSICAPFEQVPFKHVPKYVQGSPSSHCAPLLPGCTPHVSVSSSQAPTWQASLPGQASAGPPTQRPFWQVSFVVQ